MEKKRSCQLSGIWTSVAVYKIVGCQKEGVKRKKGEYLLTFLCYSVSMTLHTETDHDGMMLTLEVQTKIPVATET